MGNCRRALQMIMEELGDVDKAIEFAKEQDDAELWEDLISYSIDKPRMSSPDLLLSSCLHNPISTVYQTGPDMFERSCDADDYEIVNLLHHT